MEPMPKVWDLNLTKVYRVPASLLEIRGPEHWPHLAPDFDIELPTQFTVVRGDSWLLDGSLRNVIGFATVERQGNRLVADLRLIYDCPERLTIENKSPPLYLNCEFFIEKYEDVNGIHAVKKLCIRPRIGITMDKPLDDAPAIGEPLL
jgi:hypothetical protein